MRTSGIETTTFRPRKRNNAAVVWMSRRPGTLRSRLSPSDRSVAHRMGSAAFLAPPIGIRPDRGRPPRIRMASMFTPAHGAVSAVYHDHHAPGRNEGQNFRALVGIYSRPAIF